MTTLNLYSKAMKIPGVQNRPAQLYRRCCKEIPRVLVIYDFVNFGEQNAREGIKSLFYEKAAAKDPRIIRHLLNFGYYELEDTLLQHKQRHHLMAILEARVDKPSLSRDLRPDATLEEEEAQWLAD